jgi:hypothetical protein
MAIRTTDTAVGLIIEVDEDIPLDPFIESASALVDEVCVPLGYTDARLELIERWLSAHLYATRDPRAVSEAAGSVSTTYQSKVDLGFNNSHYGQMAMRMDTKGGLALLDARIKTGLLTVPIIWWLGSTEEELAE